MAVFTMQKTNENRKNKSWLDTLVRNNCFYYSGKKREPKK